MTGTKLDREAEYNARQGQTFIRREQRRYWGGGRADPVHDLVRFTNIGHAEEREETSSGLVLTPKGIKAAKPRTSVRPEQFTTPSHGIDAAKLDESLRLMRRGDVTKLARIDAQITKLRIARKTLMAEAFERADAIEPESLKAAIEKRYNDSKRGYPGNARTPRVKGRKR